ncbi:hypothetical protein ACFWNL_35910 [Kitasatospora sp. NPDC058397]|uniref:hypothetical protein n=1 Tax=unclassified Kitasatospora TaxID=2633591 RepID=UPI003662A3C0
MTTTTARTAAAVLGTAALLALAGCSSDGKKDKPADPSAAVLKTARTYQEAAASGAWPTACPLMSTALRGGSVEYCLDEHAANPSTVEHWSPEPTESPSPTVAPPTYADGSTPAPPATATPTGPDYGDIGPITLGDVISVPASGRHPAGYGVLATFTVTWPGKEPTTDRRALRLVSEDGAWRIDQHEDAITSADQLRAVLLRG